MALGMPPGRGRGPFYGLHHPTPPRGPHLFFPGEGGAAEKRPALRALSGHDPTPITLDLQITTVKNSGSNFFLIVFMNTFKKHNTILKQFVFCFYYF